MDMQGYYPMTNQAPTYIRPDKAEDWEPYRPIISELYKTKKLKDVMEEMETLYFFKATTRQYKGKIKQWGLDTKYTKTEEYMEILKSKKKMEKGESSGPQTHFTASGKPVSDSSVSRFERRAKRRGILPAEEGDAGKGHQQQHNAEYDPEDDLQDADYDPDYADGYDDYDYAAAGYQEAGPSHTGEHAEGSWAGY